MTYLGYGKLSGQFYEKNVDFMTNLTEFVSTVDIICQYNLALIMFFDSGKIRKKNKLLFDVPFEKMKNSFYIRV